MQQNVHFITLCPCTSIFFNFHSLSILPGAPENFAHFGLMGDIACFLTSEKFKYNVLGCGCLVGAKGCSLT